MPGLPEGTVTFLFTDIEGSTRLWDTDPGATGPAIARHDQLLRTVIQGQGGHVFKTIGDAFCAAFHTPQEALAAACAAQRAVVAEPWPPTARIRVRMALHTGVAESRDDDYFGPSLNRVARLLALAHGGQVLASQSTQDLLRDAPVGEVAWKDLGEARLKDLVRPERVYQVLGPGLPRDFPALRGSDPQRPALPTQGTSFVGREEELEDAAHRLETARLLTFVGVGGAGKTRVALQLAGRIGERFPAGVFLVDLCALADPQDVVPAIAAALEIREEPSVAPLDTIVRRLRERGELLLLLDNCEHVVDACATACARLLSGCAALRIVATSREPLRVPDEVTFALRPLAAPDPGAGDTPESLKRHAAVQLFIDRARAVKAGFDIDAASAPAMARICHRLDGIPLAIELAAARVRSMSLPEIEQRLDRRFQLLTGGARTALPRQQTLRSLVDWSYELLSGAERALLERVSVFAGPWTLEAAESVCTGEPVGRDEVLDLLGSLVDKSLLIAEERDGRTRHRLLETLRAYAAEKLAASGTSDAFRARLFAHYHAFADRVSAQGNDAQLWVGEFLPETPNLRAALAWGLEHERPAGTELVDYLRSYWFVHGDLREGLGWARRYIAAGGSVPPLSRSRILHTAAMFAILLGEFDEGRRDAEESLALCRSVGAAKGVANNLRLLAHVASLQGDPASARRLAQESCDVAATLGDPNAHASSLNMLANVHEEEGDFESARLLHERCLEIARAHGIAFGEAATLNCLGHLALQRGDAAAAVAHCGDSLRIRRQLGARSGVSGSLRGLAGAALLMGDPTRAVRLHAAARRMDEEMGWAPSPRERAEVEEAVAAARGACEDAATAEVAWAAGFALADDEVIDEALASWGR